MKKNKPGSSVGCEYLAAKTISRFGKNDVITKVLSKEIMGLFFCMVTVLNYF
jgi:hypothetical protein